MNQESKNQLARLKTYQGYVFTLDRQKKWMGKGQKEAGTGRRKTHVPGDQ